ncbi:MAG: HlyD family efflux transporter periplasmic adaptor subunit, partial [Pirellulaceae bacterium]|nr:HlyD family efflux transporter periplasmic adaptor subunit [Pirellulaceae bacterium]
MYFLTPTRPARRPKARLADRRGVTRTTVVSTLLVVVLLGAVVWWAKSGNRNAKIDAPLLTSLTRGPYEHIVLEQGEIESSENVEVRCSVKNRSGGNSPSTTILDVIPEGSTVKEGDWLVTFDSSALEQSKSQQLILVKTSETLVIQSKAAYDTAVISRKEYLEGTYQQERKTIENEIFVAEDNLKKAELSYDSIKRSVARGLISSLQLQGEKFNVDAARKQLELAKQKLHVLDSYTKEKMLTQLDSDIEAAKIKWENEQASYQEELKTLKEYTEQIAACTAMAPQDGQVVYANVRSSRSGSEFVVEPGASVRERQVIIRLPDPAKMQVSTKVSESQISLVREGMACTIRIDAIGDESLEGVVTKVNKYAEAGSWWSSSAKEYKTTIQVIDPPPQIRSGLTAEVRIHIENVNDALQLPVQAIMEHKGRTFCLVKTGDEYATFPVAISSTNDKVVAVNEAAEGSPAEGSEVVLHPRGHFDLFDFKSFTFEEDQPPPDVSKYAAQNRARDGQGATAREGGAGFAQRPGGPPRGSAGGRPGQAGQGRPTGGPPGGRPGQAGQGRPTNTRPANGGGKPKSGAQGNSAQGNSAQGNSAQGNSAQGNSAQGNSAQGNSAQGNSAQGN